jgi:cell division protein FtsL
MRSLFSTAPRSGSRRGLAILIALTVLCASTAAICQVWTRMRAIEYGYKLSRASKVHAELREANRRLRLEVAVLTSPSRIARVAAEELGLRPPAPEQIRRLRGLAAPRPAASVALQARDPESAMGAAAAREVVR